MVKTSSCKWALRAEGLQGLPNRHLELHLGKDRGEASLRSTSFIRAGLTNRKLGRVYEVNDRRSLRHQRKLRSNVPTPVMSQKETRQPSSTNSSGSVGKDASVAWS